MLEEYAKRPANDKWNVEVLMCLLLSIVLATIAVRFIMNEF